MRLMWRSHIKRWLGWRDSNPLYRSQSPVCYHYTTSQYAGLPAKTGRHSRPVVCWWGGIWGSNPRHPEPQSGALPTELIPPYCLSAERVDKPLHRNRRHPLTLARQEGFEPPTYCLEGSCSILLSYWRICAVPTRSCGAGDGNRTHVSSLEGWCSTIELHPHGRFLIQP